MTMIYRTNKTFLLILVLDSALSCVSFSLLFLWCLFFLSLPLSLPVACVLGKFLVPCSTHDFSLCCFGPFFPPFNSFFMPVYSSPSTGEFSSRSSDDFKGSLSFLLSQFLYVIKVEENIAKYLELLLLILFSFLFTVQCLGFFWQKLSEVNVPIDVILKTVEAILQRNVFLDLKRVSFWYSSQIKLKMKFLRFLKQEKDEMECAWDEEGK